MAVRASVACLIAVGLLLPGGCQGGARPNLVLITIDTLRPDRLGFGGNPRATSPHLDALAAQSRVFERAYSVSGWTLPSVATLLTGRRPREHGATSYDLGLAEGIPTLAERLSEVGYDTRGFVSHVLLGRRHGLHRGFGHFDASVLRVGNPHEVSTAVPLTNRALSNFAQVPLVEPFFVWLHYFDPHFKYLPHRDGPSFGRARIDRYDGEIRHVDAQVGRLLSHLDAEGRGERTVVVFTSDHGEEFGEHGGRFHDTLYEEVLRVPLTIRAPGLSPGRSAVAARQIDLLPTLLQLLGQPVPEGLLGRDLITASEVPVPMFFERDLPLPFRQRGMMLGSRKLYVTDLVPVQIDPDREAPGRSDYKPRLAPGVRRFDLEADPAEAAPEVDLDPDDPLLRRLLAHFDEGVGPENRVEVDPELIEQLQDLGYVQ